MLETHRTTGEMAAFERVCMFLGFLGLQCHRRVSILLYPTQEEKGHANPAGIESMAVGSWSQPQGDVTRPRGGPEQLHDDH